MPNSQKLITLAKWLGAEKALLDIGQPSEWNQAIWVKTKKVEVNGAAKFGCGTACCAAGHQAIVGGGEPVFGISTTADYYIKRWEEMSDEEKVSYKRGSW